MYTYSVNVVHHVNRLVGDALEDVQFAWGTYKVQELWMTSDGEKMVLLAKQKRKLSKQKILK